MFDFLFLLLFISPLLIPGAIALIIIRARRNTRRHQEHESDIGALRSEVRRIGERLKQMESTVLDLQHSIGDVARVSGEPEMLLPARRAASEVAKPKEKRAAEVARPKIVPKPAAEPKPEPARPRRAEIDLGGVQPQAAPAPAAVKLTPAEPTREELLVAKLLENWTGILGTIVLVAGIGFLGTYAAIRMPPVARFGLVLLASAALYGGYMSLQDRERWQAMALWLRSCAAAVFLFACAAAGALPNVGLMWIESAGLAFGVLMAGVVLNLALAWSVHREGFATLHVILALIPIAILPQATMTLGIVTAIAVFAVLLAQQHRWGFHLAAAMVVYAVYHLFWIASMGLTLPLRGSLGVFTVGSAMTVYFLSALSNYREEYAEGRQEVGGVVTHLAGWGALAAVYMLHLAETDFLGPVFLVSGLVAFALSINARQREIMWLRDADVLIAQAFILGSLLTWRALFGPPLAFSGLIFLETLLFLRVVINDGARPAVLVGTIVAAIASLLFIAFGVDTLIDSGDEVGTWQLAALMIAGAGVTILAGDYLVRWHHHKMAELIGLPAMRATGLIASVMILVALVSVYEQMVFGVAALAVAGGLLFASRRLTGIGLMPGLWLAVGSIQLIAWFLAIDAYAGIPMQQLAQLVPAALLTGLVIWQPPAGGLAVPQRQSAIVLLAASIGLSTYLLANPVSALLPTVVWVLLSLVGLEIANRLATKELATVVLDASYAYVFAAGVGYVSVVLPTLTYVGTINLRMVMEAFGVGALMYWWFAKPSAQLAGTISWKKIHPYFLELSVALVATSVLIEMPLVWRPLAWMMFAFLFLAPQFRQVATRFVFYSMLAYFTSIVAVAINVSTAAVPSDIWYEQPWNTGLVAIAVQLAYLFVAYRHLDLQAVSFQPGLQVFERLSAKLALDRAATICYPFFAGLALFLAWRFEQTLLTFLWASEVFAIFILSIALQKNHFRLVALGGMAACLGRLVVYDMQEADLFVRGLVFVGVGGLMLAMNAVYNKYGTRVAVE